VIRVSFVALVVWFFFIVLSSSPSELSSYL
jgi:hypothetical protein